jgi:hypothetical protein
MAEPCRAHYLGEFTNALGNDAEVEAYLDTLIGYPTGGLPFQGQFYKDTTVGLYRIYTGTVWEYLNMAGGVPIMDCYREPGLIAFIQPDLLVVTAFGFDDGQGATGDGGIPVHLVCNRQIDIAGGESIILKVENDDTPPLSDLVAVQTGQAVFGDYHTHSIYWDYDPPNSIATPNQAELGWVIMAKIVVLSAAGDELDCLSVKVATGGD